MDDQTLASSASEEKPTTTDGTQVSSLEQTRTEHREAYGTAKTENLRDSGLWRTLLPAVVALCCLALLAIPLIILFPLFYLSVVPGSPTGSITWVWIVMIVLEVFLAAVIIRGLVRIFMTQAENYSHP
jgi:hypothetical protein